MKNIYTLLLLLFLITQNAIAQCIPGNVGFTVQQPTSAGGTGTVVFTAQQSGYYIMNTRDYGNQYPLFTGVGWPGTAGTFTFNNLPIGTYAFVLLRPLSTPSNINNPDLGDDYFCSQFNIEIKVTPPQPFTILTNNTANCSASNGSITIAGLPNINVYGVKFPGQSVFTQTYGAASITSAANFAVGNYSVVVTTDVNDAGATQYKLPAVVQSNSGICITPSNLFSATAADVSNCGAADGVITVSGLPVNPNFGIKFPTESSFTQTNGVTTFSNPSWYNLTPGFYTVELSEVFNNPAARKYLLPVTINSATGACVFPYTASAASASNCNTADAAITISDLPQWQGYGVLFPGQSTYISTIGAATSVTSPAAYAPGTYLVQVRQGSWVGAPVVFTFVTIGSATGPCAAPSFTITGTSTTNCFSANGTITVSGFPLNRHLYGVKFPGSSNYIQLNPGETTIATPVGTNIAPGVYNVIVTENVFNTLATTYNLPVTIAAATGSCPPPAPSFSVIPTNASACSSTDGRISVFGFITGQNYGVKFPDQQNFMLVADGQTSITSPAGLYIPPGIHEISISSDVYNLFAPVTAMQVTVGSASGVCTPATNSTNEFIDCSSNEIVVYSENFGASGVAANSNYNGSLPPGYITDYTFINSGCLDPEDGKMSIINTTDMTGRGCNQNKIFGNIQVTTDHTGNAGGAFMFVNCSYSKGKIFEKIITGLCAGSLYTFSAWVKDLSPYVHGNFYNFRPIPPKVSFFINGLLADDDALPVSTLIEPAASAWVKVGFQFYANSAGSATLIIRNNAPGGIGNDFAIDDIVLAKCEPNISVNTGLFCTGGTATLNPVITGGNLANTRYRWYKNNVPVTGWNAFGPYATSIFAPGNQFFVEIAEATNTTAPSCVYKSSTVTVTSVLGGCYVLPNDNIIVNNYNKNGIPFIKWSYNNNAAVEYYFIQYSKDGRQFETVKIITANGGNNTIYNKQIADYIQPNANYFRVIARLKTGKEEFSTIISLKNNDKAFFTALNENPVTEKISLTINSNKKQNIAITVADILGRVAVSNNYTVIQGYNKIELPDAKNLANGSYFIKVNTGNETITLKILVRK
jgi:hypothetical protein